jgi:hypothetical protein
MMMMYSTKKKERKKEKRFKCCPICYIKTLLKISPHHSCKFPHQHFAHENQKVSIDHVGDYK